MGARRIGWLALSLVVAMASYGVRVAAGASVTSGPTPASATGFATARSLRPPTRTTWRLPPALRDLSPEGAPLALSADAYAAAESRLNVDDVSTSVGLYAWTTAGDVLWSYDPHGLTSMSPAVSSDGSIVVAVGIQPSVSAPLAEELVRVSATGAVLDTEPVAAAPVWGLASLGSGLVMVAGGLDGRPCTLTWLTSSATLLRTRTIPSCSAPTAGADGTLLVGPYGLDARTGAALWQAPAPPNTNATLLAAAGSVVMYQVPGPVRYRTDVEAVDARTGHLLWRRLGNGALSGGPGGTLIAGPTTWMECAKTTGTCHLRTLRTDRVLRTLDLRPAGTTAQVATTPIAMSSRYALLAVEVLGAQPTQNDWIVSLAGKPYQVHFPTHSIGGFTYNLPEGARTLTTSGVDVRW